MANPLQSARVRTLRFDEYELDSERGLLLQQGRPLKLQPQPFRVLEYLAARAPEMVTRAELSDHVWGKGVHVDIDLSLNYCVRQIRQVLGDNATEPRFIETVPRQGYRFLAAVVGEEAGVEGGGQETEEDLQEVPGAALNGGLVRDGRRLRGAGWQWMVASGCLLLLLAVGLVARRHWRATGTKLRVRSIAVLPLENFSADGGQDYLAAGLTDELTTMLAKNSTLQVTSRTSVMQYKGARRPLPEIARALGVDGVLEGSISRTGDSVHLTVQLINAAGDRHIWAESYDRDVRDLVSLPREVAETIAKRLDSTVVEGPAERFVSPEAHEAYLHGRYLWYLDNTGKAGEYFKKATVLQPDYAPGWSGLSIYYGARVVKGEASPEESLGPEEETALRAVALDETLPEAHLALGSAVFLRRGDWTRAEAEIARAIQLDPKFAEAYHFRAKMDAAMDRQNEAIAAQQKASELDPSARPWALALSLLLARRYDEALVDAQQRLESNPNDPILHGVLYRIYRSKGMPKEAVAMLEQTFLLSGDRKSAAELRHAFEQGGSTAVLQWQLSELHRKSATSYVSPVRLAESYAELGDRERTIALLQQGVERHASELLWIRCEPAYDFLHTDERYRAIVRSIHFPGPAAE